MALFANRTEATLARIALHEHSQENLAHTSLEEGRNALELACMARKETNGAPKKTHRIVERKRAIKGVSVVL